MDETKKIKVINKENDVIMVFDLTPIIKIITKAIQRLMDLESLVKYTTQKICSSFVSVINRIFHWRSHSPRKNSKKRYQSYRFMRVFGVAALFFSCTKPLTETFRKISFKIRNIYLFRSQDRGISSDDTENEFVFIVTY